jgi:hypothetical protein
MSTLQSVDLEQDDGKTVLKGDKIQAHLRLQMQKDMSI